MSRRLVYAAYQGLALALGRFVAVLLVDRRGQPLAAFVARHDLWVSCAVAAGIGFALAFLMYPLARHLRSWYGSQTPRPGGGAVSEEGVWPPPPRRPAHETSPRPRGVCPGCGAAITEARRNGLWDGRDPQTGQRTGGVTWRADCPGCKAGVTAFGRIGQRPAEMVWRPTPRAVR